MDAKFRERILISEVRKEVSQNLGTKELIIAGFVQRITKFKGSTTLLIRDSSDIISVSFSEPIPPLRNESVVMIKGRLGLLTAHDHVNKVLVFFGSKLELLSPAEQPIPIELGSGKVSDEKFRMQYRYLDLRRRELKDNLIFASKAKHLASNYLHKLGFQELDTPILSFPSKEGAQTFSTSTTDAVKTSFTLAQSPQLYKQLLMLSGFERYFQFAKSFRAEKLREDRQYEFTQLDIECSFFSREALFKMVEELLQKLVEQLKIFKKLPAIDHSFETMSYLEAINQYGTDKPDLRNPLRIFDLFEWENYQSKDLSSECCYCLQLSLGGDNLSWLNELKEPVRYLYKDEFRNIQHNSDGLLFSFQYIQELPPNSCLIYILSPKFDKKALFTLGRLREKFFTSSDTKQLRFLWITDWNYFEKDKEGKLQTMHHPFALPRFDSLDELWEKDSLHWKSTSYDLVLNGVEIASGSERIINPKLQKEVFRRLGYTDEDIQKEFGWFLRAFEFGAPPHLGIAIGWERLIATLLGVESIRDVIPFPKNSRGNCSMSTNH